MIFCPVKVFAESQDAIFAGGCFWCLEHDLEKLHGVISADSGYSGGELLEIISKVVKEREDVDQVEFALILSEIDCNLSKEANSIIHLTNFLTKLGSLG